MLRADTLLLEDSIIHSSEPQECQVYSLLTVSNPDRCQSPANGIKQILSHAARQALAFPPRSLNACFFVRIITLNYRVLRKRLFICIFFRLAVSPPHLKCGSSIAAVLLIFKKCAICLLLYFQARVVRFSDLISTYTSWKAWAAKSKQRTVSNIQTYGDNLQQQ